MTKHKTYAFLQGQTLLNMNGRLSDCICCCEVPDTLYLHVIPLFGEPECEGFDFGTPGSTLGDGQQFGGETSLGHCLDFVVGNPTIINFFRCHNGGVESPQTLWSLAANFNCQPVNQFRLNLCLQIDGIPQEEWPFGSCQQEYVDLVPTSENTCEARPGEFFAEFHTDGNGDALTPVNCLCPFFFRVDENDVFDFATHIYPYNWEGKKALPRGLQPILDVFEFVPSIQTPVDLQFKLEKVKQPKVGNLISAFMSATKLFDDFNRPCGTHATTKFNQRKVSTLKRNFAHYDQVLKADMELWKWKRDKGLYLPVPDDLKRNSDKLLNWACEEAEAAGYK